ncbi:MAG: flagellar protein FliT [Fervidobacterium sp.]|uniref:flagellar protein FliT n=1 Tax=Fervidobacterium sp. TaxID=1871331 RepID=UPI00404A0B05
MANGGEKDILSIESQIDEAIENEDYEKLNQLLDEREKLLPKLSGEELMEIYKRDEERKKKLEQKLNEFKEMALKTIEGEKMMKSYFMMEDKGNTIDRKG